MLDGRTVAAAVLAACALACSPCAVASAESDLLADYSLLDEQQRTPPPLVPLVMPAILGGGEAAPSVVLISAKGLYSLAFDHHIPGGRFPRIDASILLQDLGNRSVGGRREYFGSLFRYRKTRVRGHKALYLRARYSPVRSLVWREQGRLLELSTNTPRTISIGTLRAVAAGLQRLLGAYTGKVISADGGAQEAEVLLTDRAVNLRVNWTAPCTRPGPEPAPGRGASAPLGWVGLGAGGAFARSAPAVPGLAGAPPFGLSVSGTATVAGGQLSFRASSANGAESCAIGPLTLTLARLPRQLKPA